MALGQLGLTSISAPAQAAAWPLTTSLNAFANAVRKDAFDRQCRLYFAVRNAGNSYDAIVSPSVRGGLLDADPTIVSQGLVTVTDDGWLYTSSGAYAPNTVPGYTATQFFTFAETLYQCRLAASTLPADRSNLRQAFLADALPQAPSLYQQPRGGSYAQGGSLLLTVGASGQQPLQFQWFRNGQAVTGSNAANYRVQSPEVGSYFVEVTDAGARTTRSETVTVDLLPSGAAIAISAPAPGATLAGIVTVRATAPAATRVQFLLDGVPQVTATTTPFSWVWNTASADNGPRTLTAKAYNGVNLIGTSAAIQVTVNNPDSGSCLDANEPNNSSLSATPLPPGATNQAYICTPSDVDWFRIPVDQPGMLTLTLAVPAGKDFDLELYGPDATWVAGSYGLAGESERIDYPAYQLGAYFARVYGYPVGAGSYSTNQPYQIAASLGAPVVTGTASGTITNAVVWSGVIEPTGDVTIVGGGSLRILPGTQIRCASSDDRSSGNDPSRVEIILNGGTLDAAGTPDAPILFTTRVGTPTPGAWRGIRLVDGSVSLRHFVIEHAVTGLSLEDGDTRFDSYLIEHGAIRFCQSYGLTQNSSQGVIELDSLAVTNNQYGISTSGPLLVRNSRINRNTATGIDGLGNSLTLLNCEVGTNDSYGINLTSKTLVMQGCSVRGNRYEGLSNAGNSWYGAAVSEVRDSEFSGNGTGANFYRPSQLTFVGNTVSRNSGNGLVLNFDGGSVSAEGITGNVIRSNDVGVAVSGAGPFVLILSGNDIFQNFTFELRNQSSISITANDCYWGEPTTSEWTAGQVNLSRIYDIRDNPSVGQVLIQSIRGTPAVQAPRFTVQPQSLTALPGDSVALAALAEGSPPLTYQWYHNGGALAAATNSSLSLPSVTPAQAGGYFAVAQNPAGRATSLVAQLTVLLPPSPPVIVQHPVSQTVALGASVSFAVAATGTGPFTYQWKKNSAPIPGATAATLSIASATVADAGEYTVTVANPGGSTTSQPATLAVNATGGSAVTRQIVRAGTNFLVTVTVIPPVGTPAYLVQEFLPTNFTAVAVSTSGTFEPGNSRVVWGPFWDGLTRTLTYTLVPPSGFTGTATLNGAALFFGATAATGGDSTVTVTPPTVPARLALSRLQGWWIVSVTGEPGRAYRIEAANDLRAGLWQSLATLTLTTEPRLLLDWDSLGQPRRFYRAVLVE